MKYSEDYSLEEILNKIPTHCNPAAVNRKLRPCENCESVGRQDCEFWNDVYSSVVDFIKWLYPRWRHSNSISPVHCTDREIETIDHIKEKTLDSSVGNALNNTNRKSDGFECMEVE